jgi:hypothetical protein
MTKIGTKKMRSGDKMPDDLGMWRGDDPEWIAFLADKPGVWEGGRSEAEAIGKLVITEADRFCVELGTVCTQETA